MPASYDEIVVTKKVERTWENGEPRGRVYSFDLTLTAVSKDSGTAEDVRKFRISFDLPTGRGAKAEASGVDVIVQDGTAYLSSVGDQFADTPPASSSASPASSTSWSTSTSTGTPANSA
ncbi:hypothetical protein [Streptomyces mutabilis]|uniref:hypothetical protein n=1 Tax=Streptomyces mutabilis TaxID=67332 RepID=UPI0034DEE637